MNSPGALENHAVTPIEKHLSAAPPFFDAPLVGPVKISADGPITDVGPIRQVIFESVSYSDLQCFYL